MLIFPFIYGMIALQNEIERMFIMTLYQQLETEFTQLFHRTDYTRYFAPGRINLIGEHTDYNGGYVFPCAITLGTYGIAAPRTDERIRVYSKNFSQDGIVEFSIHHLTHSSTYTWANYIKGVLLYLKEAGYALETGFDLLIYGTLPNGSGLSSSASFELLIGVIAKHLYQLSIDTLELVKLGKKVENEFIGVQSGVMDQFAVGMGKKDHAIFLNCATLEYQLVPVHLDGYTIVIMNTNKRRELADSKYNERFNETRQALAQLQTYYSISSLAELSLEQLIAQQELLSDDILFKRARHAVSENARTIEATKQLQQAHLAAFGKLMNESHLSTELDYEVTGIELDTLVHAAWEQPGVLGARMTGAGFGGCAIALVANEHVDKFKTAVEAAYEQKIGYKPSFYLAHISDGASIIEA